VQVIQEGDIVTISETPNMSKYSQEFWQNPLVFKCLGKSGEVILIKRDVLGKYCSLGKSSN